MTVRLTWISHAATAATRHAAFPADEPIEEKGRAQARAMASQLDHYDKVYAGPEKRNRQTAEALGLTALTELELRECDYGRWRSCSLRELEAAEPDALAAWRADLQASPHGGESLAQLMRRVSHWLDGLARHKSRLVAVSPPSVIRAAVVHAIGAPATSFWRIDVAPLSRTQMSHDGRAWKLRAIG